mmetsp:Transcript_33844/g.49556  ORF Transcript_33844/g.49556 Transcript_33844/m.49556 type:complete len:184 (+) Transcript_33844:648-1199(+)
MKAWCCYRYWDLMCIIRNDDKWSLPLMICFLVRIVRQSMCLVLLKMEWDWERAWMIMSSRNDLLRLLSLVGVRRRLLLGVELVVLLYGHGWNEIFDLLLMDSYPTHEKYIVIFGTDYGTIQLMKYRVHDMSRHLVLWQNKKSFCFVENKKACGKKIETNVRKKGFTFNENDIYFICETNTYRK